MIKIASLILLFMSAGNAGTKACTAIFMKSHDRVLVGNNEDGSNPETRIWTVPGGNGSLGRLYFGFEDLSPQGGINEKGLWFDAFGLSYSEAGPIRGKVYPGDLQDKLMSECETIHDVLTMLKQYNRSQMNRYQWMFGDRLGNAVIVEADTVIPVRGPCQVITNFRQSVFPSGKGYECNRYRIANEMLAAQPRVDIPSCRSILASTHSEGQDVTLYSYIADLTAGLVYVYHFHNFENAVVLDVQKEIAKGSHVYNLSVLFPRTHAAESFAYQARATLEKQIAVKTDKTYPVTEHPEFNGRYRISEPAVYAGQVITISQGDGCLNLQLNDGGPYRVFPDSTGNFLLLGFSGLEIACIFRRDPEGMINELRMDGSGVSMVARREE